MSGEEQKDTSILFLGSPRDVVFAKLGPPETTTTDEAGNYVDSYKIVKGNAPSVGRAAMHGALDVLTIGIWEVIGTPVEMGAANEDHFRYVVFYDSQQKIKNIQQIEVGKDK